MRIRWKFFFEQPENEKQNTHNSIKSCASCANKFEKYVNFCVYCVKKAEQNYSFDQNEFRVYQAEEINFLMILKAAGSREREMKWLKLIFSFVDILLDFFFKRAQKELL